ncbi:alpha/beta hydrolase [Primorskyibacter sp. 2E233]|jgi:arylformamidase|uniref:Arylformamidase n=2 Tax=Roseovarius azorensis TaxID=1287727 RepID=A0A1H7XZ47_9RHOB|nr:arylformamidase [Roseovarius azorensis]
MTEGRMIYKTRLEQEYRPWASDASDMDLGKTMARWARRSADFLGRADVLRNIAYGPLPDQRLDLMPPARPGAPVQIFIHGGYWQSLDKDDYAFALEPLVSAGAMVVSVNYTLCPAVTLDALVDQVRHACAWVWHNARDHGGDPARLHVTGHSAGGHLAAMMAATDWAAFQPGLPPDMIKSAVPVSGLFDLEPLRFCSVNAAVQMDRATAARNSPRFMTPAARMPISIVAGADETGEARRQSRDLATAWQAEAGRVAYIETPGHHHFSVVEAMTEPGNPLTATLLRHLGLPG